MPTLAKESSVIAKRHDRIDSAIELGRRITASKAIKEVTTLCTPESVLALMQPRMEGLEVEKFWCLCLDTKNHLKKMVEVSTGSLNASIVHPRELFRTAVAISAASVIITHNHPSGDSTPSGADITLTRRLVRAGDVLGIEVLDHVVIGGGTFTSLRDIGSM